MAVRISSKLHSELLALAAASPELEVCGLLVGRDCVERIIPAVNVAADPRRNFEIDPTVLFAAIRAERSGGEKIYGYYHSHPTGSCAPSATDLAQAAADGRVWLIIAVGQAAAWSRDTAGQFNETEIHLIS